MVLEQHNSSATMARPYPSKQIHIRHTRENDAVSVLNAALFDENTRNLQRQPEASLHCMGNGQESRLDSLRYTIATVIQLCQRVAARRTHRNTDPPRKQLTRKRKVGIIQGKGPRGPTSWRQNWCILRSETMPEPRRRAHQPHSTF
jgi:hypothetical protein